MRPADSNLENLFRELEQQAAPGERTRSADLRYAGQGYELNVPAGSEMVKRFHAAHRQRFGYADENRTVEVVTLRLRVTQPGVQIAWKESPVHTGNGAQALLGTRTVYFDRESYPARVYDRDRLRSGDSFPGPAIVVEYTATAFLPPRWNLHVDAFSNLILERAK
jgi:N-methylhydantoinase A